MKRLLCALCALVVIGSAATPLANASGFKVCQPGYHEATVILNGKPLPHTGIGNRTFCYDHKRHH